MNTARASSNFTQQVVEQPRPSVKDRLGPRQQASGSGNAPRPAAPMQEQPAKAAETPAPPRPEVPKDPEADKEPEVNKVDQSIRL